MSPGEQVEDFVAWRVGDAVKALLAPFAAKYEDSMQHAAREADNRNIHIFIGSPYPAEADIVDCCVTYTIATIPQKLRLRHPITMESAIIGVGINFTLDGPQALLAILAELRTLRNGKGKRLGGMRETALEFLQRSPLWRLGTLGAPEER